MVLLLFIRKACMRLNDIKTKKTFLSRELDKKNFLLFAMIGDKHIFEENVFRDKQECI